MGFRSYLVELDLNNKQRHSCVKHAGVARWAYNWALRRKMDTYRHDGTVLTYFQLHPELVRLKKTPIELGGLPWLGEVSKSAPQYALQNLDTAFKRFFSKCRAGAFSKGFPRFKSRRKGYGSFTLQVPIKINQNSIQLPRIGIVRIKESGYIPVGAKVLRATVSERAGHWFASVMVREEDSPMAKKVNGEVLGVDLGVKHLAILSDGTKIQNPKTLTMYQRKLAKLSRAVSRKVNGSENRKKAKVKLARLHYKISCIRRDSHHKATTAIVKRASLIVIEDLNISGLMKNRRVARVLADASLHEFRRQLEYKSARAGVRLIHANRFYPSSKTCSACGVVKSDLMLKERIFCCQECGLVIDRDLNAAVNLKNLAAGSAVSACGPEGSGLAPVARRNHAGMKQEPSTAA